jgi:hypothetical protein
MVGPGHSYNKMITGKWIANRYDEKDESLDTSGMF